MEFIVFIILVIVVVGFISDYAEKERKKEEEIERKRKEEKEKREKEKQYQEKLKVLRETEFFRVVSCRVNDLMVNDLVAQIEMNGNVYPATLYIKTTHVSMRNSYEKGSACINFNSLGYKNLTGEQRYDFMRAMETNGFHYHQPSEYGYEDYLTPRSDYWNQIIDEIKIKHNSQFTDPF